MKFLALISMCFLSINAFAYSNGISTDQVPYHVGKMTTVCGKIVQIVPNPNDEEGGTFINLDRPFPNQPFYFFSPYQTPSRTNLNKRVCGTGVVQIHKEGYKTNKIKYQIVIRDISKLSIF